MALSGDEINNVVGPNEVGTGRDYRLLAVSNGHDVEVVRLHRQILYLTVDDAAP